VLFEILYTCTNCALLLYVYFGIIHISLQDFDELLHIAEQGDHRNIDMLVRDIYGGTHGGAHGLPADLIASSFGKAARSPQDNIGIFVTLCFNYHLSFILTSIA